MHGGSNRWSSVGSEGSPVPKKSIPVALEWMLKN